MRDIVSSFLTRLIEAIHNFDILSGWLFAGALLAWLIFSAVLVYHWFKYNLGSAMTPVAIAAYGFVSFALIGYAASGL